MSSQEATRAAMRLERIKRKQPSVAQRIKKKVLPVRTVVMSRAAPAAKRVGRAAVSYARAYNGEPAPPSREQRNLAYVERKTAQSAYVRGRQAGIAEAAYKAGQARGTRLVQERPPTPQPYRVGGYSLMGELGGLAGGETDLLSFARPQAASTKKGKPVPRRSQFEELVGF